MIRMAAILSILFLAAGPAYVQGKAPAAKNPAQTGLAPESANPPAITYKGAAPGENALLPLGFAGAPPQIPHDIAEMVVDLNNNDCIGCHDPSEPAEGSTPAPASHLAAGGKIGADRYQCVICHVPQADVKPLVKNTNDSLAVIKKKK